MQLIVLKALQKILQKPKRKPVRKKVIRAEEEDATSLGGWLFADSFLALMVIFLATISFVPTLGGAISSTSNIGNVAGSNFVKGLNLAYENFDEIQIQKDIAEFAKKEGIPENAKVLYANIVGGFNASTETEDEGRFRALMFNAKLKVSALDQFATTKVDLGASKQIKPNLIVLRLTLSGA
jgi:hypothetical protein